MSDRVDRFAYYSLGVQALISLVAMILSFWLIYTPTEPAVNQFAGNVIIFIIGVWLGRGIDYGTARWRDR